MGHSPEHILIIDDDKVLCSLLSTYLETDGLEVDFVDNGEDGLERALTGCYSLIILDVMLPGGYNGFAVLQNIRMKINTPVLMLTARGEEVERIIGLEMGADDYLAKPFNPRELLARIHAIFRRVHYVRDEEVPEVTGKKYRIGDVEINIGARVVLQRGKVVDLTEAEFNILSKLMQRAGEVVTRDELVREVLGRSLSPFDRSIDVHVSRLRKKLGGDNFGAEQIMSIRGAGYIYATSFLTHEETILSKMQ